MIFLKTPQEIAIMREGNRILALLFEHLGPFIQPGITTAELDRIGPDAVEPAKTASRGSGKPRDNARLG